MSAAAKIRLGILGCGNVFERYVAGLRQLENLEIVWCADLDLALAQREAETVGIPAYGSPDDALAGRLGDAELVLNLKSGPVRAMHDVTLDRLAEIDPIEEDLARRNVRVAEIDLRFRDQVIARLQ